MSIHHEGILAVSIRALIISAFACAILSGTQSLPVRADADESSRITPEQMQGLVKRFRHVAPGLMCGGQPDDGALAVLKKGGVKTVIDLRDSEGHAREEQKEACSLGLEYFNIALSHRKKISSQAISKFLSIVNDPEKQPIFIHCHAGRDRTSAMIAVYRLDKQGWTATRSYEEMVSAGFHTGFKELTASVFDYASQLGRPEKIPIIDD